MDYHAVPLPTGGGTSERKAFSIERSARQGCSLFPLLYVLALEPLLCRDERARPALRGVSLIGCVRAKISAFSDDISLRVPPIGYRAVKLAVERYEKMAGAKVNFDKSEGLRLGAWRGGFPLPGPFRWSDGPICILGMWFGLGLQLERNWLEVRAKVEVQVATWLQRRLSLKGRAEVCTVYIFLLILYHLSVLPLPKDHRVSLEQSLFKLLWKGRIPFILRQVCCQRSRDGDLRIPDLECHWFAERLTYLGRSLTTNAGRDSLSVALGARLQLLEQLRVLARLAACSECVGPQRLGFYRSCLADMPDCPRCGIGLEETAFHAFYYCERVRLLWNHVEEWTTLFSP